MPIILIVEDQVQVLVLAESVLQEAGHETISAGTVAEAQAIIHSNNRLDLIFTDIGLGNLAEGGITIGQSVGQSRSGTPVLYTSGRPATDGMQSLFAEPSAFLPKPYTAQELTDAVTNLLKAA
jgi:DNA-binding NtrC family response regulator